MTTPVTDGKSAVSPFRRIATISLGPIILVIASLLVGVVHVPQHKSLSLADEYVYIDYLSKVPHQLVVHQGEETDTYARQSLMCRGLWHVHPFPASNCTEAAFKNDALFPYKGRTSADIYTPLYFAVTWALAQPFQLLGVNDLTNAGRLVGTIWLAAAALVLYAAARRLGIGRALATGTGLLLVGSLASWWANTYVTTDATALLAGATMLYLSIVAATSRRIHWWFVSVAVLATLFKLQNFAAVAAACLFLLGMAARDAYRYKLPFRGRLHAWIRDRRTWTAILAVVASLAAQAVWLYYRAVTTVAATKYEGLQAPLKLSDLFSELFRFIGWTGLGASGPSELGRAAVALGSITTVITIIGVVGLLITAKSGSRAWMLALSALVVTILIGPALALSTYATTGVYFPLPTRYGTSLFPVTLICVALFVRKRQVASGILIGLAVVSYGLSLAVPG